MAKTSRKRAASVPPSSRWFRVTGERFDWMPKPNVMISFLHGSIGYRPQACIDAGLAAEVIEVIEKPKGYSVDKAGNVLVPTPQKIATTVLPDCSNPAADPLVIHEVTGSDAN